MLNGIKYSALRAIRDKEFVLSSLLIAILMGTVNFFMADNVMTELTEGNINIPIAIVETHGSEESFLADVLEATDMFEISFHNDVESIMYQLEDNTVAGIFEIGETPRLIVANNGWNQNLMLAIADEYVIRQTVMNQILTENPQYFEYVMTAMLNEITLMAEMPISENQVNMLQFMTMMMIVMPALGGMFVGLERAMLTNNDGEKASRRIISSMGKFKMLIADLIGSTIISMLLSVIAWAWFAFVLGVDLDLNLAWGALTLLIMALFSVTFGAIFGLLAPGGRKAREQILQGVYMGLFMIGFIGGQFHNDTIRLINQFNPISLSIDALMALSMGSYGRYITFMSIFAGVTIVCLILLNFAVRRNRHVDVR